VIKKCIQASCYSQHLLKSIDTEKTIYVADYTTVDEEKSTNRGVVITSVCPTDIQPFELQNNCNLQVCGIKFGGKSFKRSDGSPRSQCECVIFPKSSSQTSWILFVELKYSENTRSNVDNLRKAKSQLFKTQYYYRQEKIFARTNPCYLIASLPLQSEPFANFSQPPADLLGLKEKHNVILRFCNYAGIANNKRINV
jgi:hypothetical protein